MTRLTDRLDNAPRDYTPVVFRPTFRDDLAELIADIRDDPHLAIVCAGAGFLVGLVTVVGLAAIIGLVL